MRYQAQIPKLETINSTINERIIVPSKTEVMAPSNILTPRSTPFVGVDERNKELFRYVLWVILALSPRCRSSATHLVLKVY